MATEQTLPRRKKAVRREMRDTFSDRVAAAVFYGAIGGLKLLGPRAASNFCSWLFKSIGPLTKAHKTGQANLARAYPDKSEAEREEILKGVWENLGRTTADYPFLTRYSQDDPVTKIEVANVDIVNRVLAEGNGCIMLAGHFANWELTLTAARMAGVEGSAVYRPTNNRFINDWTLKQRQAITPLKFLGKQMEGPRALMNSLKEGKVLCFVADQKLKEGLPSPFFGHDAMTTPAPARLSIKFKAPIIPVWAERIAPLHYRVRAEEPLPIPDTGDTAADTLELMAKCNAFFEEAIRRRPDQWLWLHDRWGGVRPKDAGK